MNFGDGGPPAFVGGYGDRLGELNLLAPAMLVLSSLWKAIVADSLYGLIGVDCSSLNIWYTLLHLIG